MTQMLTGSLMGRYMKKLTDVLLLSHINIRYHSGNVMTINPKS